MKPPGSYSYKDSLHKKTSHNKSKKNAYNISDTERFSQVGNHTIKGKDTPGPGSYLDLEENNIDQS